AGRVGEPVQARGAVHRSSGGAPNSRAVVQRKPVGAGRRGGLAVALTLQPPRWRGLFVASADAAARTCEMEIGRRGDPPADLHFTLGTVDVWELRVPVSPRCSAPRPFPRTVG